MKNETETRICKKCHRPLPEGYKYKKCESCRTHAAQTAKDIAKGVGAVAGTACLAVITIVTKGKFNPKDN